MHGHLVIADISGYTRFLTSTELEHANGIIGELLNAVIAAIQAPLTVSSVEGDAVFLYGVMPEGMSGQAVLESVEYLYGAFQGSLETMVLNTTCTCNACANIGSLGLKIVMHCGPFAKTEIAGRETLSGPDVILVHRLLKNRVRDDTGIDDYLMVTQACVDDLGIHDIVADWAEHTEEYEHVGAVRGYVSSLADAWARVRDAAEHRVPAAAAWLTLEAHSDAPPAVVWDHLVDPRKRTAWLGANRNDVVGHSAGRIGPGAEYHCAHGDLDEILIFTVLDMRPVDYVTVTFPIDPSPVAGGTGLRHTDSVAAEGNGSRITRRIAPAFSTDTGEDLPAAVLDQMAGPVAEIMGESLDRLAALAGAAAPAEA